MKQLLIETMTFETSLQESSSGGKKLVARGRFALADIPTSNGRVYPTKLWEREINRLDEAMKNRKALGELDHPADGKTKLQRVSHLMTNLRLENGEIIGEAEILPTPMGKILEALDSAGVKIGVSSRGFGSTKKDGDGNDVVQEDFKLLAFDFVADPATKTAFPEIVAEALETASLSEDDWVSKVDNQELVESFRSAVQEATTLVESASQNSVFTQAQVNEMLSEARRDERASMKSRYADMLMQDAAVLKESLTEEVKTQLLSDPNVAGATAALEAIGGILRPFILPGTFEEAVQEAQLKEEKALQEAADLRVQLQNREGELAEAVELGRRAVINAHLKGLFEGYENRDTLMDLMSDRIKSAEKLEDLTGLAEKLMRDVGKKVVVEASSEKVTTLEARVKELEGLVLEAAKELENVNQLKSDLNEAKGKLAQAEKSLEESEESKAKVVELSRKLSKRYEQVKQLAEGSSSGMKMVELIESDATPEAITKALTEHVSETVDKPSLEKVRDRVRRGMTRDLNEDEFGGQNPGPGDEPGSEVVPGIGLTENEFNRLAGINS